MARRPFTVRLSEPGRQQIEALARDLGVTESAVVRALLSQALQNQRVVDGARAALTAVREVG